MTSKATKSGESEVSYRNILSDHAILAVFLIGFTSSFAHNAVPAALPEIGSAFAVSEAQIGLVMTVYSLPLIFLHPVIGALVDMYGRRPVVLLALFLFGVTGVGMLFVTSFSVLLVLRGLQGVAFAGTLPLSATLVGDLHTGPKGSAAQGLRSSIIGVSNAIAPVLGGFLAVVAWYYPFSLFALAFPVMVIVYRYYPEPMRDNAETGEARGLSEEFRGYLQTVFSEAADRDFAYLIVGGFTLFFVKRGMKTFVPVFIVATLGADASMAGLILGVYGSVRILVAPLSGSLTAMFGRDWVLLGSLGILVSGTAFIPFSANVLWLGLTVAVFAGGEAIFNPVLNNTVADFADDDSRGGLMSGLQSFKSIANTVSPVVLGFVLAISGFTGLFFTAAAVGSIYGIIFFLHVWW